MPAHMQAHAASKMKILPLKSHEVESICEMLQKGETLKHFTKRTLSTHVEQNNIQKVSVVQDYININTKRLLSQLPKQGNLSPRPLWIFIVPKGN